MTIAQAAKQAATTGNAREAGRVVDVLRGRGYTYNQCAYFFIKHAGITADQFEALMYEADNQEE